MEANASPSEPPGKKMNFLPLQLVSAADAAPSNANASRQKVAVLSIDCSMFPPLVEHYGLLLADRTAVARLTLRRSARCAGKDLLTPTTDRQPNAIKPTGVGRGGQLRGRHLLARSGDVQLVASLTPERDAGRIRHRHRNDGIDLAPRRVTNDPCTAPLGIPQVALRVDDGAIRVARVVAKRRERPIVADGCCIRIVATAADFARRRIAPIERLSVRTKADAVRNAYLRQGESAESTRRAVLVERAKRAAVEGVVERAEHEISGAIT